MLRLTRSTIYPIGLDVGHESVKLLQLGRVGESLSVVACAQAGVVVGEEAGPQERYKATIEAIRQALRRGSFHGRKAVAALPREMLHVRNLRLPPMPASELPGIVRFEAKNVLPFDPGEATIEFLPAGEVRQGTDVRQEVIVLGAKNQDLDQYIETISQGGVILRALDIQPCALYRTVDRFVRRREDDHEVSVLVDVGAQRSQVVIGKGKEINFIKLIDIGGRHFQNAVSRKLGISLEEAHALRRRLAETPSGDAGANAERDPVRQAANDATRAQMEELGREIALCLRYYSVTFRGQRPTKVRMVGGEAHDPQLLVVLNRVLPIPAEIGRVLLSVDTSRMSKEDRSGPMTQWAVALGLGLKCVEGTFGPRDGKPRTATREEAAIAAQLVDINNSLRAAGAASLETAVEATAVQDHQLHENVPTQAFMGKSASPVSPSILPVSAPPFSPKPPLETSASVQTAGGSTVARSPVGEESAGPKSVISEASKPLTPVAVASVVSDVGDASPARDESPATKESDKRSTLHPPGSTWRVLAPNGIDPPAVPPEEMPLPDSAELLTQSTGPALEASHA